MKPSNLLNNFDTVIFDMDGVLTSEENYWRCAALTVFELLESDKYFGKKQINISELLLKSEQLYNISFDEKRLIVLLKNLGVNTNWDLSYVLMCGQLAANTTSGNKLFDFFKELNLAVPALFEYASEVLSSHFSCCCDRSSDFWTLIHDVFNEWYYGDELFYKSMGKYLENRGKPGFVNFEIPMHGIEKTVNLLKTLYDAGLKLGIGTGRGHIDLDVPIQHWKIDKFFNKNNIITHDECYESSNNLNMFLSKPNPFVFLKALLGRNFDDKKIISKDFDTSILSRTLVVGDAGADMFAAQAGGMKFCAVLTGPDGKNGYDFFKDNNSDYILDSVLDLID